MPNLLLTKEELEREIKEAKINYEISFDGTLAPWKLKIQQYIIDSAKKRGITDTFSFSYSPDTTTRDFAFQKSITDWLLSLGYTAKFQSSSNPRDYGDSDYWIEIKRI